MKTSIIAALALALCGTVASGREIGIPGSAPAGNTVGAPAGVALPPGWWISSHTSFTDGSLYGGDGSRTGQSNELADQAFRLVWSSNWTLFGGHYQPYVLLPLLYNDQSQGLDGYDGSRVGFGNIEIRPIDLFWRSGENLHFSAGVSIYAPTGSWREGRSINSAGNFWTVAPSVAVTYIGNGWNTTAHLLYFSNTENRDTDYRSGDEVMLNLTAMKDWGDWSIGPVAYFREQVTNDRNNGTTLGGTTQGKVEQRGIGLSVTRQFDDFTANMTLTRDVHVENTVGGTKLWLNLTFPIGAH